MTERIDNAEYKTSRRPCPKCDGGLPIINPFEQKWDVGCLMCGGEGFVFENNFCACGRPAVYHHEGSKEDVCIMEECWKLLEEKAKNKDKAPVVPRPGYIPVSAILPSEEDWEEERMKGFGGMWS